MYKFTNKGDPSMNIYDFEVEEISGKQISLYKYKGYVILVVNTASKCGFTPQLKDLEIMFEKLKDKKFIVLGFPCNQFANQEPNDNQGIKEFCSINYGVTFPIFAKIDVNGKNAHELYKYLKNQKKGLFFSRISWNFTKFLIDREGNVVKRYSPKKKISFIEDEVIKYL